MRPIERGSQRIWSGAALGLAVLSLFVSSVGARADGDLGSTRLLALQQDSSSSEKPSAKGNDEIKRDTPARKNPAKTQPKGAVSTTTQGKDPESIPAKAGAAEKAGVAEDVAGAKETAVRKFVEQQLPELESVLNHLKEFNSHEYQRAVRDLSRTVERLAQSRERDQRRYELELKQWQNQSRIDLLVARLKMANSEEYREPLRVLLRERLELKTTVLQLERDRLVERMQKIEQQLQAGSVAQESLIDSQLRTILAANRPAKSAKGATGAGPKKNSAKAEKKP